MRKILMVCFAVVVAVLVSVTAWAQTGPWQVVFPANPDHATVAQGVNVVASYELVITPAGGAALPAFNLNKPAPVAGNITVDINTYLNGVAPGTYSAVIRALGPGGQAVSPASTPFSLVVPAPRPQAAPVVSRS
jgi:hypothetical protein